MQSCFLCFEQTIPKAQKTELHTDLLVTHARRLRLLISLKPHLIKFNYNYHIMTHN